MLGLGFRSIAQRAADAHRRITGTNKRGTGLNRNSAKRSLKNNLHVKDWFLDREAVIRLMDRRQAFVFSKFGYAVMKQDRASQKFRVGPSAPGTPPHAHKPHHYVRKFTFFSYDKNKNNVVIGPVLLPKKAKSSTVPEAIEYGKGGSVKNPRRRPVSIGKPGLIRVGSGARKSRNTRGKLVRVSFATIRTKRQAERSIHLQELVYGRETFHVKARPHTHPAFEQILPTLPSLWTAAWNRQK